MLSYLKSPPSNLWNCKTLQKKKKWLKLGSKMPYLGIFALDFKKLLSYLKSNSSNKSNCKISQENENR